MNAKKKLQLEPIERFNNMTTTELNHIALTKMGVVGESPIYDVDEKFYFSPKNTTEWALIYKKDTRAMKYIFILAGNTKSSRILAQQGQIFYYTNLGFTQEQANALKEARIRAKITIAPYILKVLKDKELTEIYLQTPPVFEDNYDEYNVWRDKYSQKILSTVDDLRPAHERQLSKAVKLLTELN